MQARGQVLITAAELAGMIQAGDPVSSWMCAGGLMNLTGMRPTYRVTCRERYLCHSRTN